MKNDSLPTSYIPAKSMIIGTNKLENVVTLLSFNGYIPILIGDGEKPHIWINIPTNKEGTDWYPLVKDNFSTNSSVIVIDKNNQIKITTPEGTVLDCEKLTNGTINVKKLDLRPFSLNVQADNEKLIIMNQTFTTSTFNNVSTMFSIGNA